MNRKWFWSYILIMCAFALGGCGAPGALSSIVHDVWPPNWFKEDPPENQTVINVPVPAEAMLAEEDPDESDALEAPQVNPATAPATLLAVATPAAATNTAKAPDASLTATADVAPLAPAGTLPQGEAVASSETMIASAVVDEPLPTKAVEPLLVQDNQRCGTIGDALMGGDVYAFNLESIISSSKFVSAELKEILDQAPHIAKLLSEKRRMGYAHRYDLAVAALIFHCYTSDDFALVVNGWKEMLKSEPALSEVDRGAVIKEVVDIISSQQIPKQ